MPLNKIQKAQLTDLTNALSGAIPNGRIITMITIDVEDGGQMIGTESVLMHDDGYKDGVNVAEDIIRALVTVLREREVRILIDGEEVEIVAPMPFWLNKLIYGKIK